MCESVHYDFTIADGTYKTNYMYNNTDMPFTNVDCLGKLAATGLGIIIYAC